MFTDLWLPMDLHAYSLNGLNSFVANLIAV